MRRSRVQAAAGALLALGAPAGWLLVRSAQGVSPAAELAANRGLYLYLLLGTALVFATFGAVSGALADRLARLNEELRQVSTTDPLTGLANLRQFRERLQLETARARRSGEPLALIILDVDGLKALNDRLGHDGGDAALVHVAAALRGAVRQVDLPCRIGGDEFAIVCPMATGVAALTVAERVRSRVEREPFRRQEGISENVTVSLGVAALASDADQLFKDSDDALYRAKASGRNKICLG